MTPEQQQAQRHDQLEPTRDGHEATQPRPAEPERQATPRPEPVRKDDDTVNRPDRPGLVPRSQQATPSDARRAPDVSQTQLPDMRDDKPAHQVAPDPERAPISPGQPVPQSNFELPDDIRALRPDARAERMIAPPESDPQQRQPDSY